MRIKFLFSLSLVMFNLFFSSHQALAEPRLIEAVNKMVWSPTLSWMQDDIVLSALIENNETATFLSPEDIDILEASWKDERARSLKDGLKETPFISSVVQSHLSHSLRLYKDRSHGAISEIILLNYRGMSVGMTSTTVRFSQRNSLNYKRAFLHGAVHTSRPWFNARVGHHQVLVSMPVIHPFNMEIIGAAILVVNADVLSPGYIGEPGLSQTASSKSPSLGPAA